MYLLPHVWSALAFGLYALADIERRIDQSQNEVAEPYTSSWYIPFKEFLHLNLCSQVEVQTLKPDNNIVTIVTNPNTFLILMSGYLKNIWIG